MAIESRARNTSPVALIVHGWNDNPEEGWLGWLSERLAVQGYEVRAPHLSTQERPLLRRWHEQIRPLAADLDEHSLIVAHSLGCFIVLRLLESLDLPRPIGKVVLVSGFYDAPNESARKFFSPEPNWAHIRSQAKKTVCIASGDDTIVTPDRSRRLAHKLDAELVMLSEKGHFLGSRGMPTFPELLDILE